MKTTVRYLWTVTQEMSKKQRSMGVDLTCLKGSLHINIWGNPYAGSTQTRKLPLIT